MPDAPPKVFISYSRKDTEFVLRLQATLQARGIDAWVDLRKLEGGEPFAREIEKAIRESVCLLVVLSPDSKESEWVENEISFAGQSGTPIIPLMFRATPLPVSIGRLHYIDFQESNSFDQAVQQVQIALDRIVRAYPAARQPGAIRQLPSNGQIPGAIQAGPVLPLTDPDLNALYRDGVIARTSGDIERAGILWQQILDTDANFRGGQVREEMSEIQHALRAIRAQRMHDLAVAAMNDRRWQQAASAWQELLKLEPVNDTARAGVREAVRHYAIESQQARNWGDAIGAWQTVLKLIPGDPQAIEYLPIAQENQEQEPLYNDAEHFVQQGNEAAARERLEKLWKRAPYYGDPAGIAAGLGMEQARERAVQEAEQARLDRMRAKRAEQHRVAMDKRRQLEKERDEAINSKSRAHWKSIRLGWMLAGRIMWSLLAAAIWFGLGGAAVVVFDIVFIIVVAVTTFNDPTPWISGNVANAIVGPGPAITVGGIAAVIAFLYFVREAAVEWDDEKHGSQNTISDLDRRIAELDERIRTIDRSLQVGPAERPTLHP